jgi:hypothetical protein
VFDTGIGGAERAGPRGWLCDCACVVGLLLLASLGRWVVEIASGFPGLEVVDGGGGGGGPSKKESG